MLMYLYAWSLDVLLNRVDSLPRTLQVAKEKTYIYYFISHNIFKNGIFTVDFSIFNSKTLSFDFYKKCCTLNCWNKKLSSKKKLIKRPLNLWYQLMNYLGFLPRCYKDVYHCRCSFPTIIINLQIVGNALDTIQLLVMAMQSYAVLVVVVDIPYVFCLNSL